MKNMKYVAILCFVLLLSACTFGETTVEKLSTILSGIYDSESGYREVQSELVEAEKKEQANFQRMMELTKDQKEELKKIVDETAILLEERLVLVKKEEDSIKQASEKTKQIETLIAKMDDKAEKANLEKVQKALKDRYVAYDALTKEYNSLATVQNELYKLLIAEETQIDTIQKKVAEVNEQSKMVKTSVENFNKLTTQLNQVREEVFASLQKEKK